ncbi:MAG: SprB repeat-containing protein, partial [Bacteroidota bacterium]|nr:SprB repeat-containing protein [Bacteroidota bacterium]
MKHFLSLKNVWALLFMLTISTGLVAQPNWYYTNTGTNHTVLIQPGTVTINGTPISNGDFIGVFYDSAGTLACAGYLEYTGIVTATSAWGSEAGVDNGFQTGEAFSWKVWQASNGTVVDMVATYNTVGFPNQGVYATNGMSGILTLTGSASTPLSASNVTTNVSCYGLCDGAIDVTAAGGTPPYSYLWSNGATDEDLSGLCAGNFDVTVTAGSETVVLNIVVSEPAEIVVADAITDVLCYGDATGAVDLTVSGGVTPYTYAWSNGASTEDLSGVVAGTYDVTITDNISCSITGTYTVSEANEIVVTDAITDVICNGDAAGAIDLTVSGGVSPYAYTWSNGALTEDLSGVVAGSYDVTITDDNTCTYLGSYTITEPSAIVVSEIITDVLCNGDATGAINITVSGGVNPYTFVWSNGELTEDISGLVAGSYSVTVTDNSLCEFIASYTISEPTAIAVSEAITDVLCYGNSTGAIDLTVSGGITPYSFVWNTTEITEDISGLAAGNYDVVVTDNNNCTYSDAFTISQPAMIVVTATLSDYSGYGVSANGASDGSIDITVSGGITPYSFAWSNGEITEDLSGLGAGTYELTMTDANACTYSDLYTITEPPAAAFAATGVVTDILCYGDCNGDIDLTVAGGVTPYTYNWSNGANTEDLSGLCAGQYDVTVTDGSGGSAYQPFDWSFTNTGTNHTILMPLGVITIDGNPISQNDVIGIFYDNSGTLACAGYVAWTGAPTAMSAWGSEPGYSNGFQSNEVFSWKVWRAIEGDIIDLTATYQVAFPNQGNYVTNGMSGLATLSGTSSGGGGTAATTTASFTIVEPTQLVVVGAGFNIDCYGASNGSIDITVSGGTTPYTFGWSNSEVTEDISGLGAGTFDVLVTDANLCTATYAYTVTEPALLSSIGMVTDAGCYGYNDGAVDLTVSGGIQPYSFLWSNGAISEDITNVGAGVYEVTITDFNGCVFNGSYTISQPGELLVTYTATDVMCFDGADGTIDLTIIGGTTPYLYTWSGGEQTEDIANLTAGAYEYTVTDANNCEANGLIMIYQPDQIVLSGLVSDYAGYSVSVNGASDGWIDLSVTGGITPYSYLWSNGETTEDLNNITAGNYTVTVTDDNGCVEIISFTLTQPPPSTTLQISAAITDVLCNGDLTGAIDLSISGGTSPYNIDWSNLETTEDISGLSAGTYDVTVIDQASNVATGSYTITEPTALALSEVITDVLCNGDLTGAIDLSVSGGVAPYIYTWNTGAATEDISGLPAATYDVEVIDANGCSAFGYFTITEPTALALSEVVTDVLCNGDLTGAIDLSVSGGVTPYIYTWNTGAATEDISGLAAGTYDVEVVDANGCSAFGYFTITEPTALALVEIITDVLCNGDLTGAIDLSVSGGLSPYTYTWSNSEVTEDISGLAAGAYDVEVVDANGCSAFGYFTITEPTALALVEIITDVLCNGDLTGAIDITVSGGISPYAFAWSNGEVTEDISGLAAGTYDVEVTDANNCIFNGVYTVSEAAPIAVSEAVSDVFCNGDATGSIDITVSGGTSPYTFEWSNTEITEDLTNIAAGTYDVTVTDANACAWLGSYTVNEPVVMSYTEVITDVLCAGDATGAIDVAVAGGISPYTFSWSNGSVTEDISGVVAGTYTVLITDANGCILDLSFTISEPAAITITENITDVACYNGNDGMIEVIVSGGVVPYSIAWANSSTTFIIDNLVAGTYDYTVTDDNACEYYGSAVV